MLPTSKRAAQQETGRLASLLVLQHAVPQSPNISVIFINQSLLIEPTQFRAAMAVRHQRRALAWLRCNHWNWNTLNVPHRIRSGAKRHPKFILMSLRGFGDIELRFDIWTFSFGKIVHRVPLLGEAWFGLRCAQAPRDAAKPTCAQTKKVMDFHEVARGCADFTSTKRATDTHKE